MKQQDAKQSLDNETEQERWLAYQATLPKNQMPYEYFKRGQLPLWARRDENLYWIPLLTRKNTKKFIKDYCVGLYKFVDGKWTFQIEDRKDDSSWWVVEDNQFVCNMELDDPNTPQYYLAADSEEQTIGVVFVPCNNHDIAEITWSEFETDCLFSRMKILSTSNKPRPLPSSWNDHAVTLHKLTFKNNDPLQQECLQLILSGPHANELEPKKDCFFLTAASPQTQTAQILAYAIGQMCNIGRIDQHWKAFVLHSCQPSFHFAHQLLVMVQQTLKIACFPKSVALMTYWEQFSHYLADSAIDCAGWDFQDFLEIEIDGFWDLLPFFHVYHNFFM